MKQKPQTSKATSLKELAKLLSISPSTVSKALNDSPEISMPTKKRVKQAAQVYGYMPNQIAKNLKTGQTKTLGVVIPNVLGEFFGMVLQAIEKEACKNGYRLLVCLSGDSTKKEEASLTTLMNGCVDGIMISLAKETQRKKRTQYLNKLVQRGIPLVQFDRVDNSLHSSKVFVNNLDGAYMATKYLLDTGCERIAFLSPIADTSVGQLRKQGYLKAIKQESALKDSAVIAEIANYKHFNFVIDQLLKDEKIDAILAADEFCAVYAMNVIQSLGLKIPKDVSVIGFTDGKMAQCAHPPLTTVSQQASSMGRIAFLTLLRQIDYPDIETASAQMIRPKLIVRESTKESVKS